MKLWHKILIGFVLGGMFGFLFKEQALHIKEYILPFGTIFINAIKMVVLPLVFSSLVAGICSGIEMGKMARIGTKTIIIYFLTTFVASAIGVLGAILFLHDGSSFNFVSNVPSNLDIAPSNTSFIDTIVGLIPSNPFKSLATGNILQVIVFAIFLGISIVLIGDEAKPVKDFFVSLAEVTYKLIEIIMKFSPYGVFALIAYAVSNYNTHVIMSLLKLVVVAYIISVIHIIVVYGGLIRWVAKLKFIKFFRSILDSIIIAFSTSSSTAALPVSLELANSKVGIKKSVSSFVLPLGATVNMDGTAIYQALATTTIASIYGINLNFSDYTTIIITTLLGSIGTAGVPGAGLIMLSIVLASVGLPLEGIALIAGIDRLLDMARTTVNVFGDLVVCTVVGKTENMVEEKTYAKNR